MSDKHDKAIKKYTQFIRRLLKKSETTSHAQFLP